MKITSWDRRDEHIMLACPRKRALFNLWADDQNGASLLDSDARVGSSERH